MEEKQKLNEYQIFEKKTKEALNNLLKKYGGKLKWDEGDIFVQFIAGKANILRFNLHDNELVQKIIFLYNLVDEADFVAGFTREHEQAQDKITKVLDKLLCYDIDNFINIIKQIATTNFSHNRIDKREIYNKLGIVQDLPTNIEPTDYIEKLIIFNKDYKLSKIHLKIAKLLKSKKSLNECLDYCEKTIKEEYKPDNYQTDEEYDILLKYYLELLEKGKNYSRLLNILDYLLTLYNDTEVLYVDNIKYYEHYLKIAKLTNKEEEYQERLIEFYKKLPSLEKFKEIKALLKLEPTSDQYQELIKIAKKHEYQPETYISICINENLFSEAFETAKDNIGLLTLFAKELEDYYSEEMKTIYTSYFKKIANEAKNRNDYKKVFTRLLLLKDLKIKNTIYSEVTKYIKDTFKNKPAFIEELKAFSRKIKQYN